MTADTEADKLLRRLSAVANSDVDGRPILADIRAYLARKDRESDPVKKSIYEIGRAQGMFFDANDIKRMSETLEKQGWKFSPEAEARKDEDADVAEMRKFVDHYGAAYRHQTEHVAGVLALDRIAARLKAGPAIVVDADAYGRGQKDEREKCVRWLQTGTGTASLDTLAKRIRQGDHLL